LFGRTLAVRREFIAAYPGGIIKVYHFHEPIASPPIAAALVRVNQHPWGRFSQGGHSGDDRYYCARMLFS